MRRTMSLLVLALGHGCAWIPADDHARAISSAPTVLLSSPSVDGTYYADLPVSLVAEPADVESPAALAVRWESDLDGVLTVTEAVGEVRLTAGAHQITATVSDADGKTAASTVPIVVLAGNTDPTCTVTAPAADEQIALGARVALVVLLDDPDVSATLLSASWASDVDGSLGSGAADATGTVSVSVTLSGGRHHLTVSGQDERGGSCSAGVDVVVGEPPITSITVPDEGEVFAEGATITFEGFVSDQAADVVDARVQWSSDRDGVFGAAGPDAGGAVSVSTDTLSVGEHLITLSVESSGGLEAEDATLGITVDGRPTAPEVSLSPLAPVGGDDLTASALADDPEGGVLQYTYAWTLDGAERTDLRTATVSGDEVHRGQSWHVAVTASDGVNVSEAGEDSVTVGNAAPVAVSAVISPDPLDVTGVASADVEGSDPDGDAVTWNIAWTVNGAAVGSGYTLAASAFERDDIVAFTATPTDGITLGTSLSDSIVVSNAAPVVAAVEIEPTTPEESEDDLVCRATASDPDEDTLGYAFQWVADGAPWTGSASTTTYPGDTIRGSRTEGTSEWECTVTVEDATLAASGTASVTLRPHFDGWGATYDATSGTEIYDGFTAIGYGGAVAADVNGDGVDEIVASSDRGATSAFVASEIAAGGTYYIPYSPSIVMLDVYTSAGATSTSVGDIDGDGARDDLAILLSDGTTYLLTGNTLSTAVAAGPSMDAAVTNDWVLASATATYTADNALADIDGDGCDDVITSSYDDYAVRIVLNADLPAFGSVNLDSAAYDLRLPAEEWWGISVGAGDLDGDGFADVVVGSDADELCAWPGGGTPPGTAQMCTDGLLISNPTAGEFAGERLQVKGDINLDGYDEIIVPAAYSDAGGEDTGRVYIVSGADIATNGWMTPMSLATAWLTIDGVNPSDNLGYSFWTQPASTADVDGDGAADLVVLAEAGQAYLFLGADLSGGSLTTAAAETTFTDATAGSMGGAGDMNGDGYEDLWFSWGYSGVTFSVILTP